MINCRERILYKFFKSISSIVTHGLYFQKESGSRYLEGPALIISSHRNAMDPLFILTGLDEDYTRVVYKKQRGFDLLNVVAKCIGGIKVGKRNYVDGNKLFSSIEGDEIVSVFPEGTVVRDNVCGRAGTGIVDLVLKAERTYDKKVRFVSCGISYSSLKKRLFNIPPPLFTSIRVNYGEPFYSDGLTAQQIVGRALEESRKLGNYHKSIE